MFPVSRLSQTADSDLAGDCCHHTGGLEVDAKPSEVKQFVRHHTGGSEINATPSKVKQFVRHHIGGLRGLLGAPSPYWRTAIGSSQAFKLAIADALSAIRRLTSRLMATCRGSCFSLTAALRSCAIWMSISMQR